MNISLKKAGLLLAAAATLATVSMPGHAARVIRGTGGTTGTPAVVVSAGTTIIRPPAVQPPARPVIVVPPCTRNGISGVSPC
jgi:hypothetical protein